MLQNLLAAADLAHKQRDVGIGEVSLYALLGFLIVFVGIALLIFVVWVVGKVVTSVEGKTKAMEKVKETDSKSETNAASSAQANELDDEIVAVIAAALTAYYQTNNPKCEFTVKRIKRI